MKISKVKKADDYLVRIKKLAKRGYFPYKLPGYNLDLVHPASRKPLLKYRVKRRNKQKYYYDHERVKI